MNKSGEEDYLLLNTMEGGANLGPGAQGAEGAEGAEATGGPTGPLDS